MDAPERKRERKLANIPGSIVAHPITSALEQGGKARTEAIKQIKAALKDCDGVVTHASRQLGVTRWTMIKWFGYEPDLDAYAKKLREDSDEHAQRMAQARENRWQVK